MENKFRNGVIFYVKCYPNPENCLTGKRTNYLGTFNGLFYASRKETAVIIYKLKIH